MLFTGHLTEDEDRKLTRFREGIEVKARLMFDFINGMGCILSNGGFLGLKRSCCEACEHM